jgi:hypothetical protein
MTHYAKVLNGKVEQIIIAEPEFFTTFKDTSPGAWIQTSYNTRGNVHYGVDGQPDGGVALRGNYAGVGYTYDEQSDVFYAPSPYPSWVLNINTWLWEAPVAKPTDEKAYNWEEATQSWIESTPV